MLCKFSYGYSHKHYVVVLFVKEMPVHHNIALETSVLHTERSPRPIIQAITTTMLSASGLLWHHSETTGQVLFYFKLSVELIHNRSKPLKVIYLLTTCNKTVKSIRHCMYSLCQGSNCDIITAISFSTGCSFGSFILH
jgi:hypothetical protein